MWSLWINSCQIVKPFNKFAFNICFMDVPFTQSFFHIALTLSKSGFGFYEFNFYSQIFYLRLFHKLVCQLYSNIIVSANSIYLLFWPCHCITMWFFATEFLSSLILSWCISHCNGSFTDKSIILPIHIILWRNFGISL